MEGWIKLHRKMLDNPIVSKDSDYMAVWVYLLLNATYKEHPAVFGKDKIMLQPGQLITGRISISNKLRVSESKIQRILSAFESEQQIEQQTGNKNRLITVLSWSEYQSSEQQDELEMNNKRTTDEQQVNTNKKERIKELKKNINKDIVEQLDQIPIKQIIEHLNLTCGTSFKHNTEETKRLVRARFKAGFTLPDFIKVIDTKHGEWATDNKMRMYLRPQTLFGTKFESYLNQPAATSGHSQWDELEEELRDD